ncbi:MAG: hypothetical protein JWQ35_698 [Bacteriovoracaceae bacterium]|nr:hypothetical protein [Bacteriovoracaceae bacterium]
MGLKELQIPGLNVQEPWAQLIIDHKKTVETRTYPIPSKHLNKLIAIIETYPSNAKTARVVGIVKFSSCFQYKNKAHFKRDEESHLVSESDIFAWSKDKKKWGWKISYTKRIPNVKLKANSRRGIDWCSYTSKYL